MSPTPPIKISGLPAPDFMPKMNFAYGYYCEATCVRAYAPIGTWYSTYRMYGRCRDQKKLALQAIWPYNRVTMDMESIRCYYVTMEHNHVPPPPPRMIMRAAAIALVVDKGVILTRNHSYWSQISPKLWPYNWFLALHPIFFRVGKSVPSQNWPYNQFGLTSEGHTSDTHCIMMLGTWPNDFRTGGNSYY